MNVSSTPLIRFGLFELDTRSGELRRQGSKINLQQQPFQALVLLLARPGEVVTREELARSLWPENTFNNFDRSLSKAINKLRVALRDNCGKPRYIETLPHQGYRFIAPLTAPPAAVSIASLTPASPGPRLAGSNGNSLQSAPASPGPAKPNPAPYSDPPRYAPAQAVPEPPSSERHWKIMILVACAALAFTAVILIVSSSSENGYLSHTRLGQWMRHIAPESHASSQSFLTERPSITGITMLPEISNAQA